MPARVALGGAVLRAGLAPAAALVVLALLLLPTGCVSHGDPPAADRRATRPSPTPGGPAVEHQEPPSRPMTGFETQVAAQLSGRLSTSGLHVDYLDCPSWDGRVPARMSCRGYVSGTVSTVLVRLRRASGRSVGLDAWLADGLVAARKLEATVRGLGWTSADCGGTAAYPATVGSRIVCRVAGRERTGFVVATVRSRSGDVTVTAYRPPP